MIALWVPKYKVSIHDPCCYPLGFMYISAILKQNGYSVTVLNNNLYVHDPSVLEYADAVLFTGFEEFMSENITLSDNLRKLGIRTVLGGATATFDTDNVASHFDAVVIGEGEGSVLTALKVDGVHQSEPVDMASIPWPDYEGFGIQEYHKLHHSRYMGVMSARGCPHSCNFCSSVCKFRVRSLADVRDEITHYIDRYKIEYLVVNDNTLNCTKRRLADFSDMIRPFGIKWSAAMRLDNLDDEVLSLAKAAGLNGAVVGVESFDQAVLDRMNKQITVGQIETGLNLLRKLGIEYIGNLLHFSMDDFAKNQPYLEKYGLFPTGVTKFVGNKVDDVIEAVHDKCKEYVLSRGMGYAR